MAIQGNSKELRGRTARRISSFIWPSCALQSRSPVPAYPARTCSERAGDGSLAARQSAPRMLVRPTGGPTSTTDRRRFRFRLGGLPSPPLPCAYQLVSWRVASAPAPLFARTLAGVLTGVLTGVFVVGVSLSLVLIVFALFLRLVQSPPFQIVQTHHGRQEGALVGPKGVHIYGTLEGCQRIAPGLEDCDYTKAVPAGVVALAEGVLDKEWVELAHDTCFAVGFRGTRVSEAGGPAKVAAPRYRDPRAPRIEVLRVE
mmetsp:Transcript_14410/g.30219  ORF Transcript_14410/g.30219 Transcript_14410/m.30219 type:complete len:257 (+) Transcript_14410:1376-2146(+)